MTSVNKTVMDMYRGGSSINSISRKSGLTESRILDILLEEKKINGKGRSFTDEFRKIIAERDIGGIARKSISEELKININTVVTACAKFGNKKKNNIDSTDSNELELQGVLDEKGIEKFKVECYNCGGKRIRNVEKNSSFCIDCNGEYSLTGNKLYKVNWGYVE